MSGGPVAAARLPHAVADAILQHAREASPNEACGLIVGSGLLADGGVARRYVRCRNAAAFPASRYVVDRDDLLEVLAEVDRTGEELWGVVHSHVRTPAVPSSTDLREAVWPAAVYLVISLAGGAEGDVRAWRVGAGSAAEIPVVIDDAVPEAAS